MNKQLIHFVHGNGFPSACYRQLFDYLQPQFRCCFIDRVGHTERYPVTENWHHLVEEVIASVERQADRPVIALGHSLGGVLSLLATIERPDLFESVIMLDSPLFGWFKSTVLRLSKKFGFIDRITPAHMTRGRRKHWHSREQVYNYLIRRSLFKTFSKACLNDYIDYGLEKDEKGYTLRFDTRVEYQIYRTMPHILHQYENKLTRPAALIYGDQSDLITSFDLRYMNKKHKIESYKTQGTHMFPMEHPRVVAELIGIVINQLNATK